MYHCHIHFYFTGNPCNIFEAMKKMSPPEHFSYEFSHSGIPQENAAAEADVIFANLQGADASSTVHMLASSKRKEAELILLAEQNQLCSCENALSEIRDIWPMPMSEAVMNFRLLKWQEDYKAGKDFWEVNHFLDAALNSSPNLVWYKTKDGIHEKVNESFCQTVSNRNAKSCSAESAAYRKRILRHETALSISPHINHLCTIWTEVSWAPSGSELISHGSVTTSRRF